MGRIMAQLDRMIIEVSQWREFYAIQYKLHHVPGSSIEAAACAIRETALRDAKKAILAER